MTRDSLIRWGISDRTKQETEVLPMVTFHFQNVFVSLGILSGAPFVSLWTQQLVSSDRGAAQSSLHRGCCFH